eukprot:1146625-Pelagomonas_calceolata.AAC.3
MFEHVIEDYKRPLRCTACFSGQPSGGLGAAGIGDKLMLRLGMYAGVRSGLQKAVDYKRQLRMHAKAHSETFLVLQPKREKTMQLTATGPEPGAFDFDGHALSLMLWSVSSLGLKPPTEWLEMMLVAAFEGGLTDYGPQNFSCAMECK